MLQGVTKASVEVKQAASGLTVCHRQQTKASWRVRLGHSLGLILECSMECLMERSMFDETFNATFDATFDGAYYTIFGCNIRCNIRWSIRFGIRWRIQLQHFDATCQVSPGCRSAIVLHYCDRLHEPVGLVARTVVPAPRPKDR